MTIKRPQRFLTMLFILALCFGSTACSSSQLVLNSRGHHIESRQPLFTLERYEPVIYPADPTPDRQDYR